MFYLFWPSSLFTGYSPISSPFLIQVKSGAYKFFKFKATKIAKLDDPKLKGPASRVGAFQIETSNPPRQPR